MAEGFNCGEWQFREMSRGEMNTDPVEGEFFTPSKLADSVVRESIQNSLDARAGNDPVVVRFFISGDEHALSPSVAKHYFEGLRPHLDSLAVAGLPSENEPLRYFVVEDFGTRGLCGDPHQEDDTDPSGPRNDFFYFWRNIGRSSKRETELGRWGLGKTVFPASSRINTFFGLTVRHDDHRRFLMGQSVLKIHRIRHHRYCPYGFCATFERGLPLPLEDPGVLNRFCEDFGLKRKNEPGLSIVIPYAREEEIQMEDVDRSVITQYFYPILSQDLVIDSGET